MYLFYDVPEQVYLLKVTFWIYFKITSYWSKFKYLLRYIDLRTPTYTSFSNISIFYITRIFSYIVLQYQDLVKNIIKLNFEIFTHFQEDSSFQLKVYWCFHVFECNKIDDSLQCHRAPQQLCWSYISIFTPKHSKKLF